MPTRKLKGIRRKRNRLEAFIKIDGRFYSKTFPLETPLQELRAWRERQLEQYSVILPTRGSFGAEVAHYLSKPEIIGRKYIRQLRVLLERWLEALGRDRPSASITRDEVEATLQRWLREGLAAPTVSHRRGALLSFFMALNGVDAPNPVKGTTRPPHWLPTDRAVPFATMQAIVDAMPDDQYPAPGIRRPALAKLRVRVLLHTGMPPGELMKLQAHHFNRAEGSIRMPWRDKGQGRPGYTLALSKAGLAAVEALDAAGGWGRFAGERLSASFKRAARRVLGFNTPVRLYDLRHSFGTDLYRRTGDLATVGRLLGHVEGSAMTAQYARGAHGDVDRAALAALEAMRQADVKTPDVLRADPDYKRRKVGQKYGQAKKLRAVNNL